MRFISLLLFSLHLIAIAARGDAEQAESSSLPQRLDAAFTQFVTDAQAIADAKSSEVYLKAPVPAAEKTALQDRYKLSCEALAKLFDEAAASPEENQDAKEALAKAAGIVVAYRKGNESQAKALEALLGITDQYSGTIEADEALFLAASLHVQGLPQGTPPDIPGASALLERLITRDGPPSVWTMLAEEELASYPSNADERLQRRSEFLQKMTDRRKLDWLKTTYLTEPQATAMTGQARVRKISAVIFNISESTARTSYNLAHDATRSTDPGQQLKSLQDDHQANAFLEDAVQRKRIDENIPEARPRGFSRRLMLVMINLGFILAAVAWYSASRSAQKSTNEGSNPPTDGA